MRWSDDDPIFLISSDDALPDRAFLGYCFVGIDLVIGSGGAIDYETATGTAICAGHDGSYASLRRDGAAWTLETDVKGFCHVFHWHGDRDWIVSNSFLAVVDELRRRNHRIEPNTAPIAAYAAEPDLVRTLMSFDSCVHGISLLPSDARLRLTVGPTPSLELVGVPTPGSTVAYGELLGKYLDLWTSRFTTMFTDSRLSFTMQITGGLDSRAVLGIALPALRHTGANADGRVRLSSQLNRPDDLRVAGEVCDRLGLALNQPIDQRLATRLGPSQEFEQWEEIAAGVYSHVRFLPSNVNHSRIVIGGLGGEAHRTVYAADIAKTAIAAVAAKRSREFRDRTRFEAWQASLIDADERLRRRGDAHPLALVRNHREFRDRFHSGFPTVQTISTQPLTSQLLIHCSNALGEVEFDYGQILYDLMHNAAPGLMDIPYDREFKAPDAARRAALTTIDWQPSFRTGRVYTDDLVVRTPVPPSDHDTPLGHMLAATLPIREKRMPAQLVGEKVIAAGIAVLRDNERAGNQSLHDRGRAAHLAFLLNRLCDE